VALSLGAAPAVGGDAIQVRDGRRCHVECRLASGRIADAVVIQADGAWDRVLSTMRAVGEPIERSPFTVVVHRTLEDLAKTDAAIKFGQARESTAFASISTRTAHVAMCPTLDDRTVLEIECPSWIRQSVEHESAHLAMSALSRTYRWHPWWVKEGVATWAEMQHDDGVAGDALLHDPHEATLFVRCKAAASAQGGRLVEKLLADELGDLPSFDRYAVAGAFVAFLVNRKAGIVEKLAAELRSGRARSPVELRERLRELVANGSVERLAREFEDYLGTLSPVWYQESGFLDTRGTRWFHAADPFRCGWAWNEASRDAESYSLQGEVQFLSGSREAGILVGRGPSSWTVVVLRASGAHAVYRFDTTRRDWVELEQFNAALSADSTLDFDVRANASRCRFRITGTSTQERSVFLPANCDPVWGLGVLAGSAVYWRNVEAECVPKTR
jgi:hypothetical protein